MIFVIIIQIKKNYWHYDILWCLCCCGEWKCVYWIELQQIIFLSTASENHLIKRRPGQQLLHEVILNQSQMTHEMSIILIIHKFGYHQTLSLATDVGQYNSLYIFIQMVSTLTFISKQFSLCLTQTSLANFKGMLLCKAYWLLGG